MIELKDLYEKTLELFRIDDLKDLGDALRKACSDEKKLSAFCDLVDGDLTEDWLQRIYQYYLADRKEKKQDYTPKSLAVFMARLAGDTDTVADLCAGSGSLIIQKWVRTPGVKFTAIEIDETVFPYLMFNMVIRNIPCTLYCDDSLNELNPKEAFEVQKGERFGKIRNLKSAV